MITQTYLGTLVVQKCCNCDMAFGVDKEFDNRRIEDHKTFYCPNGHGQSYTDQSEAEKLRDQLESKERQLAYKESRNQELRNEKKQLEYSVRAQKAAKTKIIKRVKNGVCPCCSRTFQNLQAHFKSVHPEIVAQP